MAFSGNFLCSSFLQELFEAEHNFLLSGGHTFKIALYDNTPSFTAATTAYTTSGELTATGNYSTGGETLTRIDPALTTTTAWLDFPDLVWTNATFTTYGGLLYNDTHTGDASVMVLDFGGAKTATAGDFTIQFPTADSSNAIIRITGP